MEAVATHRPSWAFLRSKLGSLLAIAPLGVWTAIHLWENLAIFQGRDAWQSRVTGHAHPVALVVTSTIVLAPLLFHTVWGIRRLASSRPNNQRYGFFPNLQYLLQRLSAVGVLLFLGAHIWHAFLLPRVVQGHAEPLADIAGEMRHNPPTLIVYVLGTLGVAYHLANGLNGFAMGWGIAQSRAGLKRVQLTSVLTFLALLAMSWGAIYGLWVAGA